MERTFVQLAERARVEGRWALARLTLVEVLNLTLTGLGTRISEFVSAVPGAGPILRRLMRQPGHSAAVIATLALGVGASTAMFAVTKVVVLAPPPFPEAGRVVNVWSGHVPGVTGSTFLAWRDLTDVFEAVEGFGRDTRVVTGGGPPEQVPVAVVTPGLLTVVGSRPVLGRGFVDPEGRPGDNAYVLLSHDLWARRFGADPEIIGRTVDLDLRRVTVLGVMPRGFHFPDRDTEAWLPVAPTPSALTPERGAPLVPGLDVVARLRPGLDLERANRMLAGHAEDIGPASAEAPTIQDMSLFTTPDRTRRTVTLLFGAVMLVLLIAGANVVGLGLSHALDRRQELDVRRALGAGRARIFTELLAENLALSFAGAGLGLVVAWGVLHMLVPLLPEQLGINTWGRPLAVWPAGLPFALVSAVVAAPLVTVLTRAGFASGGSRGLTGTRRDTPTRGVMRIQQVLIAGQMALAVLLLGGTALVANSVLRLQRVDTGFDEDRLLAVSLRIPTEVMLARQPDAGSGDAGVPVPAAVFDARFAQLEEALLRVPGVDAVASTTSPLPLTRARFRPQIETPGQPAQSLEVDSPVANFLPFSEVEPGFFRTAGIRILEGRGFTTVDDPRGAVVVNEALARRLWPNVPAVGRTLRISPRDPWLTVVGVASPVVEIGLRDPWGAGMEIYLPLNHERPGGYRTFLLRTDGRAPATLSQAVRQAVWSVDPVQPIERLLPLREAYGDSISRERFFLSLLAIFAILATLLAAAGVYALLSRALARSTREFGIRIALGAPRGHILARVTRSGLLPTGTGLVLGLAAVWWTSRLIRDILFGIEPGDPASLVLTAVLLAVVAVAASAGPARRALRTDVLEAIKAE